MSQRLRPAILCVVVCFAGCSAHSPFIATPTTDTKTYATPYPATNNRILITDQSLPPDKYELIQTIEVGKVFYGSSTGVKETMADQARSVGADAVIEVKTWQQPSGWSWSAPHGSGKAVKFKEMSRDQIQQLGGDWL